MALPFTTGTKVSGSYFGVEFSGVVSDARPHMMNADIVVCVDLDTPIVGVLGDDAPRTALSLAVNGEGFARGYPCYLAAA